MIKNITRLEQVINGKLYHFTCDMDSPLADCKEALFQFLHYTGQVEDLVKKQTEQQQNDKVVPIAPEAVDPTPKERLDAE